MITEKHLRNFCSKSGGELKNGGETCLIEGRNDDRLFIHNNPKATGLPKYSAFYQGQDGGTGAVADHREDVLLFSPDSVMEHAILEDVQNGHIRSELREASVRDEVSVVVQDDDASSLITIDPK